MKWVNKEIILFLLIILISITLRFYKLQDLFIFGFDEEHQILLAKTIVRHFHIIWIGVSASNLDFYLGPFWIYFTAFWLFISKGNPLITGIVASSIGVITTIMMFIIGKKLFNGQVGLISSLLYASLPLIVFSDRKYLTPTLVPLLSILMLFALYKIKYSGKWLLLFTICYGLVFHIHLSLIFFGPIAVYFAYKYRTKFTKRVLFVNLITFLIIISPLIAFDYFHKASNIAVLFRMHKSYKEESIINNLKLHSFVFLESLGRIWYLKPNTIITDEIPFDCAIIFNNSAINQNNPISTHTKPSLLTSIISLLLLLYFFIRKKTWKIQQTKLLAILSLSIVIPFLIFQGGALEYYLLGFFPLFIFVVSLLVTSFKKPFFNVAIVGLLIISYLGIFTVLSRNYEYSFKNKRELISQVSSFIKKEPFELEEAGVCHKYEGWRYLFTVYGRKPEHSATDNSLGWIYPDEISNKPTRYKVIMAETKAFSGNNSNILTQFTQGGFTAYILQNY